MRQVELCGGCHADADLAREAGLKTAVLETYERSVHGARGRIGRPDVPLCTDCHGLHAIVAIFFLLQIWFRLERGWLQPSQLATAAVFWYFVVAAWPAIYWRVYI